MFNIIETRRQFLISIGKAGAAVSIAPSIVGSCSKLNTEGTGGPTEITITLDLTSVENNLLNNVGGAIKTADPNDSTRPIIVTRISQDEVAAFSSRCTHKGCEVPLPAGNSIVCPCHQATFDGSGNLLSGPATTGLKKYEVTFDGAIVTIHA